MRLTLYTDYALRLLIQLALVPRRRWTVGEVADLWGLSRHHLTKIAHDLARAGLVRTTRGKGGGLELARAPEAIRLGELVQLLEPDFHLAVCFTDAPDCRIREACRFRTALLEAREAFITSLDRWTLADLVASRRLLCRALGLVPEGASPAPEKGIESGPGHAPQRAATAGEPEDLTAPGRDRP